MPSASELFGQMRQARYSKSKAWRKGKNKRYEDGAIVKDATPEVAADFYGAKKDGAKARTAIGRRRALETELAEVRGALAELDAAQDLAIGPPGNRVDEGRVPGQAARTGARTAGPHDGSTGIRAGLYAWRENARDLGTVELREDGSAVCRAAHEGVGQWWFTGGRLLLAAGDGEPDLGVAQAANDFVIRDAIVKHVANGGVAWVFRPVGNYLLGRPLQPGGAPGADDQFDVVLRMLSVTQSRREDVTQVAPSADEHDGAGAGARQNTDAVVASDSAAR